MKKQSKTIYQNTIEEDLLVFDNYEDAHASSIQTACYNLNNQITTDNKYVDDMENLLSESEEIKKLANDLILAIDGKFVKEFKEV